MPRLRPHKGRSRALAISATCAMLGAAFSCATMETAIVAEPGVAFSLSVGKTAALKGNGTRITFKQVREDSRCPVDVTCIWAGDAKIDVTISRDGAPDDMRILSLTPPNNEILSGDLRIRFVGLMPVPRQSDANAQRAYVAKLVVDRL